MKIIQTSNFSRNPSRPSHKSGFTLVEMLTVLSVLLILLAMLLPVVDGLWTKMETLKCQNNLRQLMQGINAYMLNSRGEYPGPWDWVQGGGYAYKGGTNSHINWVDWSYPSCITNGLLFPYMYQSKSVDDTSYKVYRCPTEEKGIASGWQPFYQGLFPYCTYTMNEYIFSVDNQGGGSWGGRPKLHFGQLAGCDVSKLAILGDEGVVLIPDIWHAHGNNPTLNTYLINNLCLGVGSWPNGVVDCLAAIHDSPDGGPTLGKGNVAFADGHVEAVPAYQAIDVFTPSMYK